MSDIKEWVAGGTRKSSPLGRALAIVVVVLLLLFSWQHFKAGKSHLKKAERRSTSPNSLEQSLSTKLSKGKLTTSFKKGPLRYQDIPMMEKERAYESRGCLRERR